MPMRSYRNSRSTVTGRIRSCGNMGTIKLLMHYFSIHVDLSAHDARNCTRGRHSFWLTKNAEGSNVKMLLPFRHDTVTFSPQSVRVRRSIAPSTQWLCVILRVFPIHSIDSIQALVNIGVVNFPRYPPVAFEYRSNGVLSHWQWFGATSTLEPLPSRLGRSDHHPTKAVKITRFSCNAQPFSGLFITTI